MKAPAELWTVARSLGDILGEVVFVGGMIRELLITDPAAGAARPTQDVDCIVNAVSWVDYVQLSGRLRSRGFSECTDEGAPICRWVVQSVRVDLMPIDPVVLGFSNVWYPSTVEHAIAIQGPDGSIRIADAVHFCATKIEAFLGRGEGDFLHHDMEDFMAVVDARPELVNEIQQAPDDVRDFIAEQVGEWLGDDKFLEALSWHLEVRQRKPSATTTTSLETANDCELLSGRAERPAENDCEAAPIDNTSPTLLADGTRWPAWTVSAQAGAAVRSDLPPIKQYPRGSVRLCHPGPDHRVPKRQRVYIQRRASKRVRRPPRSRLARPILSPLDSREISLPSRAIADERPTLLRRGHTSGRLRHGTHTRSGGARARPGSDPCCHDAPKLRSR